MGTSLAERPWLSVLMPVYNGANYIGEALNSIASQEHRGIECVVVDSDSTDDTARIVASYEDRLNIVYCNLPWAQNWVEKTNFALSQARGTFVCNLHHDDIWLSNRVDVMKKLTSMYPDSGVFLTSARYIDAVGRPAGHLTCPLRAGPQGSSGRRAFEALLVQNYLAMAAPVVRRECASRIGGWDETLWYTPDWDFWLEAVKDEPTVYEPVPTVGYRIHADAQTIARGAADGALEEQLRQVFDRHIAFLPESRQRRQIEAVGRFSMQVNTTLATALHGRRWRTALLPIGFAALGPIGWYRYLRDSRIFERLGARLRILARGALVSPASAE